MVALWAFGSDLVIDFILALLLSIRKESFCMEGFMLLNPL